MTKASLARRGFEGLDKGDLFTEVGPEFSIIFLFLIHVYFHVELGEEDLAQIEETDVHIAAIDELLDELRGERLLRLVVTRHLLQHFWFPAPVLQHLRRGFNKVARNAGAMEPAELCLAEETMEDMSHFMEESHYVVMSHERGLVRSWFGKVGYHSSDWVAPVSVGTLVAREKRPNSGMRVLRSYERCQLETPTAKKASHTSGEEIEITVTHEIRLILGILFPDFELLDL